MESPDGKLSNTSTKVLFMPKLPPSLSDWKTLKTHFSQFGDVSNVVVNPQLRWCTVSFKNVADAESAKADGCIWKNKSFESHYWMSGKSAMPLDPRAVTKEVFGYSDLDALWSDNDVEMFGVVESKQKEPSVKPKEKKAPVITERKSNSGTIMTKSPKQKVKLYSEKIAKLKEKRKDEKERVRDVMLEIRKQRSSPILRKKEDVKELPSKSDVDQSNLSLKEKFMALEEKDKLIRKSFVKSSSVKSKAIVGTCPDMCPEKERIMREFRRLVSIYEMIPGTQSMDHALAVKAYVRSSADQEEPLPHELRPEPVLSMTMSYLINEIMPLIEDPDVNMADWYDFCWDRLRGIRKDIIQQQLCDLETVTIIEQCARFHICCYDRFWGVDPLIFDEKINTENLLNCLQTLRHMYEDLSKENIKCPNEAEFIVYMILLNMKTSDLMATYQQFPENLLKEVKIQTVVRIYLTFNHSMYSQFFKLVKSSTYLDACLLQRYFYQVRVAALQAIARAYCPPNKGGSIPLKHMMNILKFDTPEDTELFCEGHGLTLKDNKKDFRLRRNDFFIPENKILVKDSSSLVSQKRLHMVEAVVGNRRQRLRDYKSHTVHSSFTKDEKLNQFPSDISNQKSKSSEMVIDKIEDNSDDVKIVETNEELFLREKDDQSPEMDVDTEVLSNYPRQPSPLRSAKDGKNDSFSNNEMTTVSGKQNISSFKFDLNNPVQVSKGTDSLNENTSGPFKFSLGTTPSFHNKNVPSSFSFQLPPKQFNLQNVISVGLNPVSHFPANKISTELPPDYDDSQSNESRSQMLSKTDSYKLKTPKRGQSSELRKGKKLFDKKSKLKNNGEPEFISDHNFGTSSSEKTAVEKLFSHILKNKLENKMGNRLSNSVDFVEQSSSSDSNQRKETVDIFQANVEGSKENMLKSDFNFVNASMFGEQSSFVKDKEKEPENIEEVETEYEKRRQREEEEEHQRKLRLREEETKKKLKKDFRQRMKAKRARDLIRKWKKNIEKIKQNRKDFPLLVSVPADQHISIWGTAISVNSSSTCSLLSRLREKRQNIKVVNAILDDSVRNTLPYIGHEIANNIVVNSSMKLNLKDFTIPLCWKLVVSVPFLKQNEFFVAKFKNFIKKLFYPSDNSVLGSVVKEITSENIPVYYCVHLVFGNDFRDDKDKVTGSSAVLFFVINGIESTADKYKRLKNLLATDVTKKRVPVALLKIGNERDEQFSKVFDNKLVKDKVHRFIEEYWNDFSSVKRVLKFFTKNVDVCSNVHVYTLNSLLKHMTESVHDILTTVKTISDEFQTVLTDPNIIINFYNSFLSTLEDMIFDSDFNDFDVIPPEFKQYIEYFNKPGESCVFDVTFNKSHPSNVVKAFSEIILPNLTPWPPRDEHELFNMFSLFCGKLNCDNILPTVIRIIDYKDNDDGVDFVKYINSRVPWINVIDVIMNSVLRLYAGENKKCVVFCDINDVSDLSRVDFGFKLLQCIINN